MNLFECKNCSQFQLVTLTVFFYLDTPVFRYAVFSIATTKKIIFFIAFQYQHQNQTKKDVVDILDQYRGLTFKLEKFGMFDCDEIDKDKTMT